jgi:hypothetical protein
MLRFVCSSCAFLSGLGVGLARRLGLCGASFTRGGQFLEQCPRALPGLRRSLPAGPRRFPGESVGTKREAGQHPAAELDARRALRTAPAAARWRAPAVLSAAHRASTAAPAGPRATFGHAAAAAAAQANRWAGGLSRPPTTGRRRAHAAESRVHWQRLLAGPDPGRGPILFGHITPDEGRRLGARVGVRC